MSGKIKVESQLKRSPRIDRYFKTILEQVEKVYEIGEKARQKGFDPVDEVEIPIADNMAARVEALVGPKNVAEKIRKYQEVEQDRVAIALKIAEDIVAGMFEIPDSEDLTKTELETRLEAAIRTATAIITGGIVSAPLEGIEKIKIRDDTNHLAIYYASPIRGAGGTAAAMTVVVADYVRHLVHLEPFRATPDEVGRYVEEIELYKRVKGCQIPTTTEEIRDAAKKIPLELNGSKTERVEVSGYRDLPNHDTNYVRGGLCLVFNDGVIGRAKKILGAVDKAGIKGWDWLKDLKKTETIPASEKEDTIEENEGEESQDVASDADYDPNINKALAEGAEYGMPSETDPLAEATRVSLVEEYVPKDELQGKNLVKPKWKYLTDVIGGRPIFSHPTVKGGFRLRYGKSRCTGLAAIGMHPATMWLLKFIASGTHVITERPGKGSIVTPISTIEGPLVRLKNGSVRRLHTLDQAKNYEKEVDTILELGDTLVGFGEFSENNHPLIPSGYVEEWWVQDQIKQIHETCESLEQLEAQTGINKERLNLLLTEPLHEKPTAEEALNLAKVTNAPLHPNYTSLWHDISIPDALNLREWLKNHLNRDSGIIEGPVNPEIKEILERAGIIHTVSENTLSLKTFSPILRELFQLNQEQWKFDRTTLPEEATVLDLIKAISTIEVKWKAPVRTGCRMGRPEKAKERKMKPPIHLLFPVGRGAGRKRDLISITKEGPKTLSQINYRACPKCRKETFRRFCSSCNVETTQLYVCPRGCDTSNPVCDYCSELCVTYKEWEIPLQEEYYSASKRVGRSPPEIKGVIKLMNKNRQAEAIEKGILRAYYNIFTFKDGTTRFDMTDAPLTHFRPNETGTGIEKLKELGYTVDICGNPLEQNDQLLEIYPQDIIVNEEALKYLMRVAHFVDDELVRIYDMEPYYNITRPKDLIGHIIIGLAPHTSTGIVGRIIGVTKARVCWAHPYWHAAKRRNCDGDEDSIFLVLDGLLNFSRSFLPDRIGGLMDAPLVLNAILDPSEVDSEAFNVDASWRYPLRFYQATWDRESPGKLLFIDKAEYRLNHESQYEGFGFTHDTQHIEAGPEITLYKVLETMAEKIEAQFNIAQLVQAVDADDLAMRILKSHLLRDMTGCLRAFGTQKFRCVKCNTSYRRIPLIGICRNCGGKIVLTVAPGSVLKYFKLARELVDKYNVSEFTRTRVELLELRQKLLLGGKFQQSNLMDFFKEPSK
ncbi:MAG: DNA polymerase II large subunit [Candidatus Hodarchaeota archaeon]